MPLGADGRQRRGNLYVETVTSFPFWVKADVNGAVGLRRLDTIIGSNLI